MKKIYCFLLILVLLFTTACGAGEVSGNKNTAELPPVVSTDYNYGKYVVSDGENIYIGYKSTVYKLTDEGLLQLTGVDDGYIHRIMTLQGDIYFCTIENMYVMNPGGNGAGRIMSMLFPDGSVHWLDAEVVGENIYLFNDSYSATRSRLIVNDDCTYNAETVEYEYKYINGRGMEYNYIPTGECGGNITVTNSEGERINIVSVNHRNMAVVTDDYIFTMAGTLNDGTDDVLLSRWSLTADEVTEITTIPSNVSFIKFAGYDKENVYICDMYNNCYYGFNQTTGEKVTADIEYLPGIQADICDGWLYYIVSDNPHRINLKTGETENLIFK